MTLEKFGDGNAGDLLNALIKIDEVPAQLTGQTGANRAFACAHETGQANNL
jgi:hypothetical protein